MIHWFTDPPTTTPDRNPAMSTMTRYEPKTVETESARTLVPRVDIVEGEDAVELIADLPGVTSANVDVRFEKGELTIHGKRTEGRAGAVTYFRSFALGEHLATDKISAAMKHGVLTLTLPKVEAVKPRKIAVKG
jgi:HSP20 family protein